MTASSSGKLRRLVDLPGVADLEHKALLKPAYADPDQRVDNPGIAAEVDALLQALFGLTFEEAEDHPRPEGWDRIDRRPPAEQAAALEALGWDATDDRRRPLRVLRQLAPALWLALRGVAGQLPFVPDPDEGKPHDWAKAMAADAARFRKR